MGTQRELALGTDAEAAPLAQQEDPAHATDRTQDKALEQLMLDVYQLTGRTVTRDDPILLAALFQSRLINRAGETAARALQAAAEQAGDALHRAKKAEHARAAALDSTLAEALQQIADGAKAVADQELITLQARFARMASDTLEKVRREGMRASPASPWWKRAALAAAGAAAGMAGGVYLARYSAPVLSGEQTRLIHNGQLLDNAWHQLPASSRELLAPAPPAPSASNADTVRRRGAN